MRALLIVAIAVLGPGCNLLSNLTSPTSSPETSTTVTSMFSGTLLAQGATFFTFTVEAAGPVTLTLTSLNPSPASGIGLGLGTPNGTTSCTLVSSTNTATASSTAQITQTKNPGTYCAQVFDPGSLTSPSAFTVSVTHS
jgi:hypothetical protein